MYVDNGAIVALGFLGLKHYKKLFSPLLSDNNAVQLSNATVDLYDWTFLTMLTSHHFTTTCKQAFSFIISVLFTHVYIPIECCSPSDGQSIYSTDRAIQQEFQLWNQASCVYSNWVCLISFVVFPGQTVPPVI